MATPRPTIGNGAGYNQRHALGIVLSNGFAARMVLHSGLIDALQRRRLDVTILSPDAEERQLLQQATEQGFRVRRVRHPVGHGVQLSARMRPYVYEDVRRNPALWSKHLRSMHGLDHGGRWRRAARLFLMLNRVACRVGWVRSLLMFLERSNLHSRETAALLSELRPAAVVSTYPVNDLEASVLLEAQRAHILTIGQLLSWDNITAKGRWLVVPDRFVAWGPVMAEELRRVYEADGDRVICAGVPHFDAHFAQVKPARISQVLETLGLKPDAPYLFFGMSSPVFAPTEIDIVERLAECVSHGSFGPRMQFVIRPHPQNVQGHMADISWLPRLEALRSDRVAVDYPRLAESSLPWSLERDDLAHLANLLGGCAVCLNSGSTLSIDAIIQDRPVVLPLFDVGPVRAWWASARRLQDYTHQRALLDLGGVRVASSFDELKTEIAAYLADPRRDEAGRRRTRERQLGECDGRATDRAADAIGHHVERHLAGRRGLADTQVEGK